ncbi:hypothetical protein SUGI_0342220 [Cryptomeria japonica]|uniref:uncharacterized protein LOC131033129 n=1 Tax=Cryptomeria japonica TaxID=3369 RepID=UPI002408A4E9|nr:uncharacterized protein LOC131033129 [Cryptomeria japonica]GLJ19064.1 hypothetical protein SUGI_0342220 [Cryptomeria japonica]
MDAGISHSLSGVLQDYARLISVEWIVWILLLISMTLQIVLVVLGARRYMSSCGIFHFVVWGAYISADAVAISALGTMMYSVRSGIYGIWAPVLLLHLGGPDAITAYSTADNELWLRHGFNMVYQVLVAVYVIYSSALEGHALVSAILLLVVGAAKYAERTLALWYASDFQIVMSCLPISKYIKEKNVVQDRGYVIMGEKQLHRMIEKEGGKSSMQGKDMEAGLQAASLEGRDIEIEPEAPQQEGRDREAGLQATSLEGRNKEKGLEVPLLKGRGIVTVEDLRNANIKVGGDYNLCLSHALYKMYMRRFVSLYFDEGDWKETKALWGELTGKEAFRIAEMELKFIYDVLFSKGSGIAFSRFGIVMRLLNCILMGVAGFLILRSQREAQWLVTYIVISVAVVVEVFQFCRILTSDWTRVRLICAHVEETAHTPFPNTVKWRRIKLMLIKTAVLALGKVQKFVGGDRYWSNGIHQHCLIRTCHNRSRFMWKMTKSIPKADNFIVSWHIHKVPAEEELRNFIFNILKRMCSPESDSETCRDGIYNFEEDLLKEEPEIRGIMSSHENLEEVILIWHIATTMCDTRRESSEEIENVRSSRILSRYCAYLLVSRSRLLPVHPAMANITYMQLVEQLMGKKYYGKDPAQLLDCKDSSVLGSGAKLACELLEKGEDERWKLLAEYWGGLVIYMAAYNKATFHAECLACGGEFLSQVWVLLGHLGCGEQSDSAVRKKIERSMEPERLERKRLLERLERLERERLEWLLERERERLEQDQLLDEKRLLREELEWELVLVRDQLLDEKRLLREELERELVLEREGLLRERREREGLEREREGLLRERLERD